MTDQKIIDAMADAIRNTAPCGDQARYEAAKIYNALTAANAAAWSIVREKLAADEMRFGYGVANTRIGVDGAVESTYVPAADLVPPLEGHSVADLVPPLEGHSVADLVPPLEVGAPGTLEEQEAAQAATRATQDANVAAASPLDAPQTGKGSRKRKTSPLDGQHTDGDTSPLDK